MKQKQAKIARAIIRNSYPELPKDGYEVIDNTRKVKQYRDLMGNIQRYETATIKLIDDCQRKKYKQLKKVGK